MKKYVIKLSKNLQLHQSTIDLNKKFLNNSSKVKADFIKQLNIFSQCMTLISSLKVKNESNFSKKK